MHERRFYPAGNLVTLVGKRLITIAELYEDQALEQAIYDVIADLIEGWHTGILPDPQFTPLLKIFPDRLRIEYLHLSEHLQALLDGAPDKAEDGQVLSYER